MVQKVAGGLRVLTRIGPPGNLKTLSISVCQSSSTCIPVSNEQRIRQQNKKERQRFSSAVTKARWASTPYYPYGRLAMGNFYLHLIDRTLVPPYDILGWQLYVNWYHIFNFTWLLRLPCCETYYCSVWLALICFTIVTIHPDSCFFLFFCFCVQHLNFLSVHGVSAWYQHVRFSLSLSLSLSLE